MLIRDIIAIMFALKITGVSKLTWVETCFYFVGFTIGDYLLTIIDNFMWS